MLDAHMKELLAEMRDIQADAAAQLRSRADHDDARAAIRLVYRLTTLLLSTVPPEDDNA